ncbi:MAG: type II toxin-antitoxin system YafQ family toxin [Synergistaceae bacterium]|jgi:mRNA interferase YafQ|nr:type II toxin-antitoxin system YafQ family toxin [Synergistaceae bacterium]
MLTPDYTGQFKKDYKLAMKRGFDICLLDGVIVELVNEHPLDEKHRDHPLAGNWNGRRECHIKGDWLLIYQVDEGVIVFERTGTHSDLF